MSTPLQTVKSEHGSKEALVDKLVPLLDRQPDEAEPAFRERLLRVPNSKLLRLWEREQTVRSRFGSREALVDAIIELRAAQGLRPDADYRRKILTRSTGQLLSIHRGLKKKAPSAD